MNTFNKVSIINATKKNKSIMDIEMEHQDNNLLLDVPDEIFNIYHNYLDLKSYISFVSTCRHTSTEASKRIVAQKRINAFSGILCEIQEKLCSIQATFATEGGSNMLLSCLLRKLIFASATKDEMAQNATSLAQTQCLEEYNRLYMHCLEEFDMTLVQFNNNLENAQFEYRGFNIIGINNNERHMLDMFKSILQETYFSRPFLSHCYVSFGDVFVEMNCDDETIMFDVHTHDNAGNWVFLEVVINAWIKKVDALEIQCDDDIILLAKVRNIGINITENWLSWPKNNYNALTVVSELLFKFMGNDRFFQGAEKVTVEVWNDTLENNWILANVARGHLQCSRYEETLLRISYSIIDEYDQNRIMDIDE
jgi:hypothetical protein